MLKLDDDRHCFACGEKNPIGLRLSFSWDGEVLTALFTPSKNHQGYKDVVHGGIISTVLDECMAQAAIKKLGLMAATAEFSVRFKSPLIAGEETVASAKLGRVTRLIAEATAELKRVSDDTVIATASSKLMLQHKQ